MIIDLFFFFGFINFIFSILIAIIFRNIYFYYFSRNILKGIDSEFIKVDYNLSYIPVVFQFEKEIPNLKEKIKKFWLNECKNTKKLRIYNIGNKIFYENILPEKLFKKTCIYSELRMTNSKMIEESSKISRPAILFYGKDYFALLMSHKFIDGASAFNIIAKLFDNNEKLQMPNFYYLPGYSELSFIKSFDLLKAYIMHYPNLKREKYYDVNVKTKKITNQIPLKLIKNFKKKNNISFISCIIALNLKTIFITKSTIEKLSVGVTYAFNAQYRYNNYSIIYINITRTESQYPLNEFCKLITNKLKNSKHHVITCYLLSNVYEVGLEHDLDVIISGFPMTQKNDIKCNGILLKETEQLYPNVSSPYYCAHLSCSRYINQSICIRTDDLDKNLIISNMQKITNELIECNS